MALAGGLTFAEHAAVWTNTVDSLSCGETQAIWGRLNVYAPVLRLRLPAVSDCFAAPWRLRGDDFEGWCRKQAFGFLGPPGAAGLPCLFFFLFWRCRPSLPVALWG